MARWRTAVVRPVAWVVAALVGGWLVGRMQSDPQHAAAAPPAAVACDECSEAPSWNDWAQLAQAAQSAETDDEAGAKDKGEEKSSATSKAKSKSLRVDQRDYELFKVFVDTLDQVERNYVKEVDRRELMEAAIRGLLTKLDPYSNYIPPEEVAKFRDSLESQFGGIGIQITVEQGRLKVLSPLVGTPAYRMGVHAGDTIVEINGASAEGITVDEAVKKLKGPVGTEVKLKVRAAYVGTTREFTLKRELIHVETVLGDRRNRDDSWNFMFDEERKLGYIRVTSFSRETYKEVKAAIHSLEAAGVKGLILDLRFNPGGLLNSAIEICDLFIKEGKIVSTKGRNIEEKVWVAHEPGTCSDFPMAILINRYSASASEIVSACLQDHKRAVVIGERSWGKGSVQNVIDLEEGKSALKLTTASYWRPSGKNIHRFEGAADSAEWGVSPDADFEVKLSPDELRTLVEVRRKRDLLDWSAEDARRHAADAEKKTQAARDPSKDDQAAAPTTSPAASGEAKSDAANPEGAKPDAGKSGETKPADAKSGDAKPDELKASEKEFVDRQFQKAVEYLVGQLEKKSEKK